MNYPYDDYDQEPLWKAVIKGIAAVLLMCLAVYVCMVGVDLHMDAVQKQNTKPIERVR